MRMRGLRRSVIVLLLLVITLFILHMCVNTSFGGITPLGIAASHGSVTFTHFLLHLGADPNLHAEKHAGFQPTPLVEAAIEDHSDVIRLLLTHGAQIDKPGNEGRNPLIWAVIMHHPESATVLLQSGANPNLTGNLGANIGWTALHWAVNNNDLAMVQLLLSYHANPNIHTGKRLETPLHLATLDNHATLIPVLVSAGAQVNARDIAGQTPLTLALHRQHRESITALIAAGGKK